MVVVVVDEGAFAEEPICDVSKLSRAASGPAGVSTIEAPLFLAGVTVCVAPVGVGDDDVASNPVLCMIDPSLRDKISVD